SALGAGSRHVVLHVLAESVLFAVIATVLGMGLARIAVELLSAALAPELLNGAEPGFGAPVAAFSVVLMLLIGLGTGLPPALRSAASDFGRAVGAGARATVRDGCGRDGLVVLQIALAFALLVCAALLFESLSRMNRFDYGFDPRRVLAF